MAGSDKERLRLRTLVRRFGWAACLILGTLVRAAEPSITPKTVHLDSINDMVWDATRSRLFVSTVSRVVIVDPDQGQIVDTLLTGESADRIAVSDDGQYLYAAVSSQDVVQSFVVSSHKLDLEIPLPPANLDQVLSIQTIITLPGEPRSFLIARFRADGNFTLPNTNELLLYDDANQRGGRLITDIFSLYVRPSDHTIFAHGYSNAEYGNGPGHFYTLHTDSSGVSIVSTMPAPSLFSNWFIDGVRPVFNGSLVTGYGGGVFNLETGSMVGNVPFG